MHLPALASLILLFTFATTAADKVVLYDGTDLSSFDFVENGWYIDKDGAMACRMKEAETKKGKKIVGISDIWTKKEYADFVLKVEYKLSEGANSGIFYRANKDNKVQEGLEIQLMDSEGFQKTHGKKDAKKLNGSFYDGKAPSSDPSNPPGQWNSLTLTCNGPSVRLSINGKQIIDVNIDDWDTPGKNPDGTSNKFKKALKDFPRKGRIGFQNHGQYAWFRNFTIQEL